ncbi:MAG: S-layer homology domain-containing protein [Clostridia bacterium]|nr:S-layer homology domain-containing protein [Clostridia bacterium]
MRKIILLLLCTLIPAMPINVFAAGGGIYVGDNSSETLFTGSASSHYLLLSSNGIVSAWGKNTYGQCGTKPCDETNEINYIDFENKVVKVAAGNDFSLALDENNIAWGWGNNIRFQLGISRPTDISGVPTYFTKPEKIAENVIDIAAGDNFSILLNKDGEVLFSGMSASHTLRKLKIPEIGDSIPKIKKINASYNNFVAVSEDNYVFYGKADRQRVDVIEMPAVDEVQSAVSGKEHLIIRCLNGNNVEFYGYGDNSKNQLGIKNTSYASEPILSLSIPKEKGQYIAEFAGAYDTVVNVWNNLSASDKMAEYRWGTSLVLEADGQDVAMIDQTTIEEPEEAAVDYQMIAVGNEKNIGFNFMTNEIVLFNYSQAPQIFPLIKPADEIKTMYEYQYKDVDYHTYDVNFIKLNEDAFLSENSDEKYLYWEYVNENQFRVKIKDFINGIGQSGFNPSISTVMLSREITGENRHIGTYGPSIWNFNIRNELYKTDTLEINHKSENGVEFTVSLFEVNRMEEKPLNISSDVNVFYENPGEITENTKLGLYLYGLPNGVTAMISDISDNTFKVTLSGISKDDLDYDSNIRLCYIRAGENQIGGAVVGEFDLNENTVIAGDEAIDGFTIKALENTPEILTVSGSLTKGKEDGKIINVSIAGGVFKDTLSSDKWVVSGIDGVSIQSVKKIDDNNVELTLSGNSKDKYTNAALKVTCDSSQYSDSREYDENTGNYFYNDLSTSNTIEVKKQSKGSGGSSSLSIAKPTSNVKSGEVAKGTAIELLSSVNKAKIYYTTDGSQPDNKSLLYQEPIKITEDVTIKFIAVSGTKKSAIQTVAYTVNKADISLKNNAQEIKYIVLENSNVIEADKAMSRYEILLALYRLFDIEDMSVISEFTDVADDNADVVNLFVGAGIIEGYPDNTFRGESGITRSEFVKILSIMLNAEKSDTTAFSDISGHWCEEYINNFTKLNLVNGYPDGTFKPDNIITKAEVIAVLNRVANKDTESIENIFFDNLDESHWAYNDICAAVKA